MRLDGNPGMGASSRLGGWIGLPGTTQEKKQQGQDEAPVAPTLQAGWARKQPVKGMGTLGQHPKPGSMFQAAEVRQGAALQLPSGLVGTQYVCGLKWPVSQPLPSLGM